MNLRGKRILVTGGAGFLGSELVHQLVTEGSKVIAVDNLVNGQKENLADVITAGVDFHADDIRDTRRMRELLHGIDIVFHLACLGVRHSIHSPLENHEVNATATLQLLGDAKAAGVSRFVYVSSSEVYGTARWVPMTEDHPTMPTTVYGASKLAGECYTRAFYNTYDYATVVIRPFNSYGPRCHHEGDSGEVIPKFLLRCMAGRPMIIFGDGTQTRDFTFVSDTARAIMRAGICDAAIGQTINVGQGKEISINDLAEKVAGVAGRNRPEVVREGPRPGDVLRLFSNSTRAKEILGFEPSVGLTEGLNMLRDWYSSSERSVDQLLEEDVVENWSPPTG